jgi:hypothetical protein
MDFLSFCLGIAFIVLVLVIRDQGHSVFAVKDEEVQKIVASVTRRWTTMFILYPIPIGPVHQLLWAWGVVFAYYDEAEAIAALPRNIKSFVTWGAKRRTRAAIHLRNRLVRAGYKASICEPLLPILPSRTFILVTSDGFENCAVAFRPHFLVMAYHMMRYELKTRQSARK